MPTEENAEPIDQTESEENTQTEDWEEKYKELLKHSRSWEKQAKANKAAAEELEKLKEEKLTKEEKLQKQLDEANAKAAALQAEKDHIAWVKEASKETGVPEDLLMFVGAKTQEELNEKAQELSTKYGKKEDESKQSVPVVLGDGKHAKHPDDEVHGDFIRELFNKR